jgi:hypothetical protein
VKAATTKTAHKLSPKQNPKEVVEIAKPRHYNNKKRTKQESPALTSAATVKSAVSVQFFQKVFLCQK